MFVYTAVGFSNRTRRQQGLKALSRPTLFFYLIGLILAVSICEIEVCLARQENSAEMNRRDRPPVNNYQQEVS